MFSLLDMLDVLDIGAILGLLSTNDGKTATLLLLVSIVLFVLTIVLLFVHFGVLTISCSKNGKRVCLSFDIAMLVMAVIGSVLLLAIPGNPYLALERTRAATAAAEKAQKLQEE